MWPGAAQDGFRDPAHVNHNTLLETMVEMEAAGIPTRFPHESHLYRLIVSKEFLSQTCLQPQLKVPLTTVVSRQAIANNQHVAADNAISALLSLAEIRKNWFAEMKTDPLLTFTPSIVGKKGIAKLGYAWEAHHVMLWHNSSELAEGLQMVNQPGSLDAGVFVQEWLDFDMEMRNFIIDPDLEKPETMKPRHTMFDIFEKVKASYFTEFKRLDRESALSRCFSNDVAALEEAERQRDELIVNWLRWLQAQTHKLPPVVRIDIVAKRLGPGRAAVATMEVTELGACTLGWEDGPRQIFTAMLRSALRGN